MCRDQLENLLKLSLQRIHYSEIPSFTDLIHQIQLELTNADISFTAPLSIYSEISEGDGIC